jgi:TonB-linked SusC/RagA family outer membrane protein
MKKNLENLSFWITKVSKEKLLLFTRLISFAIFFACFMSGTGTVFAGPGNNEQQTKKISGTVTDQTGAVLPGVSVVVKGTTTGVVTGVDGKYSIDIPANQETLLFSFVGMTPQEVRIGGKSTIDIVLAEASIGLDEVVVVGYGTQKKVNLTGSITAIKTDNLTTIATQSLPQTIMGRAPGLFVKNVSGQPGKTTNVSYNIRGFGTPLIIIDGMPSTAEVFNLLDPNDIEDFSVLKDASAAAIYGARAGDGVILVKTKRGKVGVDMTLTSNFGVQFFTLAPKFVDSWTYAAMENVANQNEEKVPIWTAEQLQKFKDNSDPNNYPNTNWWDLTIRKYAPQMQHNLNIRGGNDRVKYFVSGGYYYQGGQLKSDEIHVNKYTLRSNIDIAVTKKFNVGLDLNVLNQSFDEPVVELERGTRVGIMTRMFRARPYYNSEWPDPNKLVWFESPEKFMWKDNIGFKDQNTFNGDVKMNLGYDLPYGFKLKANFQVLKRYDRNTEKEKSTPTYSYNWATDVYTFNSNTFTYTSLYESMDISNYFNQQYLLTWDKQYGDHNFSALAVYEVISSNNNYFNAQRIRYDFDIDYLFAGPDLDKTNGGSGSETGRVGIVSRINYNYQGKYLFEFSSRYDASPKFPPDTRWGFFPSVSLGWRISKESFFADNVPFISNLKLRASHGLLGNDNTGNFQYLETYSMTSQYIFDGGTNTLSKGIRPDAIPNLAITWEKMRTTNFGLDFGLLKGKLDGSFDVFYRLRTDVLGQRIQSIPDVVGATMPRVNYAEYDNRGMEFSLNYKQNLGQFDFNLGGNIAWNREKALLVDQNVFATQEAYRTGNVVNEWTDRFWGYQTLGLFQSEEEIATWADQDGKNNSTIDPGDIKYFDYNGDGRITSTDQVLIGRGTFPRLNYGINFDVSWKGISLSMLWQGAGLYDFNLRNSPDLTLPFYAGDQPTTYWAYDSYVPDNPWYPSNTVNARWPRYRTDNGNRVHPNNTSNSDFWLINGNYLRLKTLEIAYNLPPSAVKFLHIKGCKIFVSGYNIFTLSKIDFLDPEANTSPGRTFGDYYPPVGTYSGGFVLQF